MALVPEETKLPLEREKILFSEDEDHSLLEEYLYDLVKTLDDRLFEIADVININAMPPSKVITGDYTLLQTDRVILAAPSGGARTLTLPKAAFSPSRIFEIKKIDNINDVIIDPDGSETIDGNANITLSIENEAIRIYCTGSEWFILGKYL